MAVFSVLPPFLVFPGADGKPLENGYIYIGQPGFEARTTPKASFFDTAQTIPTGTASGAAIRTMGGFPARNGSPAMFYVDGDFSISVLDRNGMLIYSALNTTLAINLGGDTGPVLAPDGNLAAVGLGFINEVNTGWIRSATGTVQYIVQGVVVAQMTATGVVFNQPISGSGFTSAVAAIAQPLDLDLTAIAALGTTGLAARTAANTWATRTITAGAGISVTNGDGVAGNPTIALVGQPMVLFQTLPVGTGTTVETNNFNPDKDYLFQFHGVRHNNGSAQNPTLAIFGDTAGAYSSTVTAAGNINNGNYGYGHFTYQNPKVSRNLHTIDATMSGNGTAPGSNSALTASGVISTASSFNWGTAQTVSKVRFGWTGGANFVDGNIIIWEF